MPESVSPPPSLPTLAGKLLRTGLAALENRVELLRVEAQLEETRILEMFLWVGAVCFFAAMFVLILTAGIIYLFREDLRIYAAGGFVLLYLMAAILAFLNLKALAQSPNPPFSDSVAEVKKDREWLESLK